MTSGRIAIYGVGAALLVAYLAAANMPGSETPPPNDRAQVAATAGTESLAVEVRSQASRLQARMAQAPTPAPTLRNPFTFGSAPRIERTAQPTVHAAVLEDTPPALPAPLTLTLMGIAEETLPQGSRRTAIIGGEGDVLYTVVDGQTIGDRYKVTKIGADAVELEDLLTHGYRRIALR